MGRRQLRVGRRSSARTPTQVAKIPQVRAQPAAPALHHRDRRGRRHRRRDHARGRCARAARGVDQGALDERQESVDSRGPVHLHLHLRHDRPAEGLRAAARQLPRDPQQRRRARPAERRRRPRLPVPAAGPRLRAADPAGVGRHRHDDRLLRRRRQADHPRDHAGQADLPAVGAAHLREALHARPGPALAGGDHGDPHDRRPDPGPRDRTASRSRTSCASASRRTRRRPSSCAACSAAACARPSPARRRSPRRSSSSSGARACP